VIELTSEFAQPEAHECNGSDTMADTPASCSSKQHLLLTGGCSCYSIARQPRPEAARCQSRSRWPWRPWPGAGPAGRGLSTLPLVLMKIVHCRGFSQVLTRTRWPYGRRSGQTTRIIISVAVSEYYPARSDSESSCKKSSYKSR
jgi:hypothetical protein